jgi:hypothetical protein
MRLAAPDRLDPRFEDEIIAAHPRHDCACFKRLAAAATSTVAWLQRHGLAFDRPPYYLSAGPQRIQPVGGGGAIVRARPAPLASPFSAPNAVSVLRELVFGRIAGRAAAGAAATVQSPL